MNCLFVLVCFLYVVSALDDDQSIIHQIASAKNSHCSNGVFRDVGLSLTNVPQFNDMCNILPPNSQRLEFLLENNVIPILCMGLYDVFQRQCKYAIKDPILSKEILWTTDKIKNMFLNINRQDDYSSLDKFCGHTVKKNIVQSASKDSDFWWNELNQQLSSPTNCTRICRTNEENKVQPICSFVIWANADYIRLQTDDTHDAKSSGKKKEISHQENITVLSNVNLDSNQIVPSAQQSQLNFTPTISTEDSYLDDSQDKKLLVVKTTVENSNTQVGLTLNETQGQTVNAASSLQLKTNTTSETRNSSKSELKFDEKSEELQRRNSTSSNASLETSGASRVVTKIEISKPAVDNFSTNKITQPEPNVLKVNDVQERPEKASNIITAPEKPSYFDSGKSTVAEGKPSENIDDLGFNLDVTPFGTELEQPNMAGGEEEFEGGDLSDDIEVKGSVNTADKKQDITLNNIEPSKTKPDFDQGDSIKSYGEVEEVIIKDSFIETEDSHFFTYFLCLAVLTIIAYLVFHNKKKLLALAVEGRRSKSTRRRPNSSNYSKLDCSLEEAMTSNTTASVTHVLY